MSAVPSAHSASSSPGSPCHTDRHDQGRLWHCGRAAAWDPHTLLKVLKSASVRFAVETSHDLSRSACESGSAVCCSFALEVSAKKSSVELDHG